MSHTLKREKGLGLQAFLLALAMGMLLFLPFLLFDKGIFVYYGDYNAQQIPFYQLAHQAVRSGNIGWSWTTDLGANFIGSYSFYMLGSPFFWLTLPFPTAWVPYLMAPLLALKMAFASLTAYAYTRRFLRPQLALIAGILYAFSGFSIYNIFFNHFHEALVWFPLLLLGMEQYMTEGRRGLFTFGVLMTALNNYYFFIGQAVFVMIYWVVRALSEDWEHRLRRFFGLWLEALLGTAAAAVLLLPSFLSVIQNGRTESLLEGWDLLIYPNGQRFFDIIHSFFFPPDLPARANFFPDANNKWSSMSAWIPVFGCTGAIAYFQSRRHTDWLRRMLIVLVICALIPAFNAAFQLFNQMYYARWYYMLTLMLILATLRCFDEEKHVEWSRAIGWSGGITAFFALIIGLVPESWTPDEETGKITVGLAKYPIRFWVFVGVAAVCLLLTGMLIRKYKQNKQEFYFTATAVCLVVCMVCNWSYLTLAKMTGNYPGNYVTDKLILNEDFALPDGGFCRVDMHEGMDNQGMYWDMPTIQAFHSIVPGSVMEFYPTVGVTRTVGSRPDSSHYALRSLLSVRWLFDYAQQSGDVQLYYKEPEDFFVVDGKTAMPAWNYYDTQNGFHIYENACYIPMGFTYNGFITRSEYDDMTEEQRELAMLRALVVEDVDAERCPLPHLDPYTMILDKERYQQDCADRAASAAERFAIDKDGFSAVIDLNEPNYVFFSVPYEGGWTATVNGQPTEIHKVNVGFMAVACPAGEDIAIRFDYETPGLKWGVCISGGALLLLALYWLLCCRRKRDRGHNEPTPITPPAKPLTPPANGFDLYAIYKPNETDEE
ncbi:MAG: YfhO family protein [Clostridia bacterium]|nr:YfhO family protein [Clostridia bacterium]